METSQSNPQLTVVVVTYNSERYIDPLFQSISHQTFRDFMVIVIDNHSTDHTLTRIDAQRGIPITLVKNRKNVGFSKAYNQGLHFSDSEYVLVTNHDVVFERECFERLLKSATAHPECSMIGPKILRFPNTDVIDTAGMEMYVNRRVLNRGEGERDTAQYDHEGHIFGLAGTIIVFRKRDLPYLSYDNGETFDESFFMYKEDVDLAWRAQILGKKVWYEPRARAFHVRTAKKYKGLTDIAAIKSRRTKSALVRFLSTRNHWAMLYKNEYVLNGLIHFPRIAVFEMKKIVYLSLFEPLTLLRAVGSFLSLLPSLHKKRRWLMDQRTKSASEIRELYTPLV